MPPRQPSPPIQWPGSPMLIDERARKCVAYLIEETFPHGIPTRCPVGTAFFTGLTIEPPADVMFRLPVTYAVTARHIIEEVLPGNQLYIRVNTTDGRYQDIPVDPKQWVPSVNSDVAVYRFDWSPDFDAVCLEIGWFWVGAGTAPQTEELVVGDEVALIGLFAEHPGQNRNQPVVRFGHVALMPHEPMAIDVADHLPPVWTTPFVVEATAWGGNSGSPVFLYWPHFREWQQPDKGARGPWLLGLVHGTFTVREELDKPSNIPGDWLVKNNAGLTVVIPARDIHAALNQPSLLEERDELWTQTLKKLRMDAP